MTLHKNRDQALLDCNAKRHVFVGNVAVHEVNPRLSKLLEVSDVPWAGQKMVTILGSHLRQDSHNVSQIVGRTRGTFGMLK